jgi:hypothetical protein
MSGQKKKHDKTGSYLKQTSLARLEHGVSTQKIQASEPYNISPVLKRRSF